MDDYINIIRKLVWHQTFASNEILANRQHSGTSEVEFPDEHEYLITGLGLGKLTGLYLPS